MSTDPRPATEAGEPAATEPAPEAAPQRPKSRRNLILVLIAAIIAVDIAAFFVVPPFPIGHPGEPISGIGDLIMANLEVPAPHVVWAASGDVHAAPGLFDVSISNTLLTMWIVMAIVLVVVILMTRGRQLVPGRAQNAFEFLYEFMGDFGVSIAGPASRPDRHIPRANG